MKERIAAILVSLAAAGAAVYAISWWLAQDPSRQLGQRVPYMDDPDGRKAIAAQQDVTKIGSIFEQINPAPTRTSSSWPRFKGASYDNISAGSVTLSFDWKEGEAPIAWSLDLGEGHAAAAVHMGRVFIMDYDEEKKADMLRCFNLYDGKEIWRRGYNLSIKRNHGMSRTIPAITDRYVVTIGPKCHVMCVDTDTGDFRWGIDMVAEYGTKVPGWYAGQCPLIDDGLAILAPGGSNTLVMAVDCEIGKVVWSTPNPGGWQMSHASIMPMTVAGTRMYVYTAVGGAVGIAAEGESRGKILWKTTEWAPSVIAPSPVILDDGKILFTAGYAAGSMMIKIVTSGSGFDVEPLYTKNPKEGLCSEQQSPLYYKKCLFSVMPKDAGPLRKQFVCYDADGELVWASGKEHRFGLGPYIVADDKILILDDDGVLTVIKASTRGYEQLAQVRILEGHDSWGPLALVNGMLLARDSKRMVCLDLTRRDE